MTVTIEQVGRRYYLKGDTYPIKDVLRGAGCRWDARRKQWWTGKKEVAERLASTDHAPAGEAKREEKVEYVAGKAEYRRKTYYVVGRVVRGRTHWDDTVEPVKTRDGGRYLLAFFDGSRTFWADATAVRIVKQYDKPQTIAGLRRYAERAKAGGGGRLPDGYYYGPRGEVLASGCSECRRLGRMCPGCAHDFF